MTIIRASCPTCGDIELRPDQLRCTDGPNAHYSWACMCGDTIRKPADEVVRALLRSGGVVIEHVPYEWRLHVGPRISYDELLDAGLLMGREETDVLRVLHTETFRRAGGTA